MISSQDAERIIGAHPHPIFLIDENRTIIGFNEAAKQAFSRACVGAPCHAALFDSDEICHRCVRDMLEAGCFAERQRRVPNLDEDRYITAVKVLQDDGKVAHVECLHPVPRYVSILSKLHEFIYSIDKIGRPWAVAEAVRDLLAKLGFASRLYEYRVELGEETLHCISAAEVGFPYVWDEGHPPVIDASEGNFQASFLAVRSGKMVYVTQNDRVREYFVRSYAPDASDQHSLIDANPDIFVNLALYSLSDNDDIINIREDVEVHDWFDIPIGIRTPRYGKLSVSPLAEGVHFSRYDLEVFALIFRAVGARLFNLKVEEAEYRRGYMEATHETKHAHQSALSGIEILRRRLGRYEEAPVEVSSKYILKNLEGTIRLMTFLNEYPNIEDARGNYNKEPISLHKDVIAPITNLVRHCILNQLLADGKISFPKDYQEENPVTEVESFEELKIHYAKSTIDNLFEQMRFLGLTGDYRIYYTRDIHVHRFYINPYRLQCVFYNLFSNALKYRKENKLNIVIREVKESIDFEHKRINLDKYVVIRITDMGFGLLEEEREDIFGPGRRGSASRLAQEAGYGKGLFVARTIMRTLGGDLTVNTERDPTGFDLSIPRNASKRGWSFTRSSQDKVYSPRKL